MSLGATWRSPPSTSEPPGAAASVGLVSCMRRISGGARSSHFSTASWRALSELTFQVAMRMGVGSVPSAALTVEVEGCRVGDGHDRHRAGLDRVGNHEVDVV